MIAIDVLTDVVECGETVRGVVRWAPEEKMPRGIDVELTYHTEGRGDLDRKVVARARHDIVEGEGAGELPFELVVPVDGPISYDGRLMRVIWTVTASLDMRLARDPSSAEVITVFPRGGHDLWARSAPPPT